MPLIVKDEFRHLLPKGLYVFTPAYLEQLFSNCHKAVARLGNLLGLLDVPFMVGTASHPECAAIRNSALSVWHGTLPDYSHILMVDADIGFEPKLIIDMFAFNQPIIGAVYPKKQNDREWVLSMGPSEDSQRLVSDDGNFVSCDGVGAGCLLIRRDAIDEMVLRYPELVEKRVDIVPMANSMKSHGVKQVLQFFNQITLPNGIRVSEDLSFCKRWLDLNLDAPAADVGAIDKAHRMNMKAHHIWAAVGQTITHVGPYQWDGCFKDEVIKDQKAHTLPSFNKLLAPSEQA